MSFQFSLDVLLRYRRNLEQQQILRVQQAFGRLAEARAQVTRLCEFQKEFRDSNANTMCSGLRSSEIRFITECEAMFRDAVGQLRAQVAALELEYEQQRQVMTQERQQREAIEQLRSQAYDRYQREITRREQASADELFLLRRHRDVG